MSEPKKNEISKKMKSEKKKKIPTKMKSQKKWNLKNNEIKESFRTQKF